MSEIEIIREWGMRKLVIDSGWRGPARRWSTWVGLSASVTGLSFGASLTWPQRRHDHNWRFMIGLGVFFFEWHLAVLPPDPYSVGDEEEDPTP